MKYKLVRQQLTTLCETMDTYGHQCKILLVYTLKIFIFFPFVQCGVKVKIAYSLYCVLGTWVWMALVNLCNVCIRFVKSEILFEEEVVLGKNLYYIEQSLIYCVGCILEIT